MRKQSHLYRSSCLHNLLSWRATLGRKSSGSNAQGVLDAWSSTVHSALLKCTYKMQQHFHNIGHLGSPRKWISETREAQKQSIAPLLFTRFLYLNSLFMDSNEITKKYHEAFTTWTICFTKRQQTSRKQGGLASLQVSSCIVGCHENAKSATVPSITTGSSTHFGIISLGIIFFLLKAKYGNKFNWGWEWEREPTGSPCNLITTMDEIPALFHLGTAPSLHSSHQPLSLHWVQIHMPEPSSF